MKDVGRKCAIPVAASITLLAIALAGSAFSAETPEPRPDSWAQPLAAKGASNFYKVSDSLYRSAQPSAEGFRSLKDLGIATVVNLRSFNSDRKEIGSTALAYEHIYMKAWHPERKEVVRFLQIVTDPKRTPVLVHCQHGSDRTGAMTAAYRIVVQGWSKEEAVREMSSEDFGFHRVWANLPGWIRDLDVEAIREEVGIGRVTHPQVDELKRQADLWDQAIIRKDRAAIEANMADDFRQIDGSGNVETKSSFVEGLMFPELEIDPYTVEDFEVRVYGDVALLSGRTQMPGRYAGEPFSSHYRYIDVYVRRNGEWRVVSVQIFKIAP